MGGMSWMTLRMGGSECERPCAVMENRVPALEDVYLPYGVLVCRPFVSFDLPPQFFYDIRSICITRLARDVRSQVKFTILILSCHYFFHFRISSV